MRRYFITGIVVLLPAVVTIILVILMANILTKPFVGMIESFLVSTGLFGSEESQMHFLNIASKLLALLLVVVATLFIGVLGHVYFLNIFGRWGEILIEKIPIVNHIYCATRDVVKTILIGAGKEKKFSKVVLVPYPHEHTRSIGLVPSEYLPEGTDKQHEGMIPVFVPGSPNPTMGFMVMYKREEVEFTNMTVEEALHLIISLGVVWENKEEGRRKKEEG